MFLKNLVIEQDSGIIRDIDFHKGLNLIIDETPQNDSRQTTGNNVGKTTVLRLVDFCFGGDGKNIYQDTEFQNQPNTIIENFLKNNNVIVSLKLVFSLDYESYRFVTIKRNFLTTGEKKLLVINNEKYSSLESFKKKLQELIFDSTVDRPTFRQIISKNIRIEKNQMSNIVKVLHQTTRLDEYEALYLFWLGIDTSNQNTKQKLNDEITKERTYQKRLLKQSGDISLINQSLEFITAKIEELNKKKSDFSFNQSFEDDLNKLNDVKLKLNKFSTQFSQLKMRYDLIMESKDELETERLDINADQIKLLYERAKSFIPDIQVTFEETLSFHNDLVREKIEYITKELPELQEQMNGIQIQISNLRGQEINLTKELQYSNVTKEYEDIISETNKYFEVKGKWEEQKSALELSIKTLERMEQDLDSINSEIDSKDRLIQSRVKTFNKYFSELSNDLYGEYYILNAKKNEKGYELNIHNLEGNPSTGKKKGQIAAFDFAYIQFADTLDIKCLHFIMHDQLESVHDNQLTTLVQVAKSINGQYIVPILRDKIPPHVNIDEYEVLSLSEQDKLFRIP